MRIPQKLAVGTLLCGLALAVSQAQSANQSEPAANTQPPPATGKHPRKALRALTADDRLSVIVAALDPKTRLHSGHDCSHLVHAIYERAGFSYAYASSDDLYAGAEGFQRVRQPQTGDLVVWRGHVGIVVRPSRHVFFSFMHAGPAVDDYQAPYWTGRGTPRFYRYIKNDRCPGCALRRPPTGLK